MAFVFNSIKKSVTKSLETVAKNFIQDYIDQLKERLEGITKKPEFAERLENYAFDLNERYNKDINIEIIKVILDERIESCRGQIELAEENAKKEEDDEAAKNAQLGGAGGKPSDDMIELPEVYKPSPPAGDPGPAPNQATPPTADQDPATNDGPVDIQYPPPAVDQAPPPPAADQAPPPIAADQTPAAEQIPPEESTPAQDQESLQEESIPPESKQKDKKDIGEEDEDEDKDKDDRPPPAQQSQFTTSTVMDKIAKSVIDEIEKSIICIVQDFIVDHKREYRESLENIFNKQKCKEFEKISESLIPGKKAPGDDSDFGVQDVQEESLLGGSRRRRRTIRRRGGAAAATGAPRRRTFGRRRHPARRRTFRRPHPRTT